MDTAIKQCKNLQDNVIQLTQEIKDFVKETDSLIHGLVPSIKDPHKYTVVQKCDLECLQNEAIMMKEFIPAVLKPAISILPKLNQTEQELVSLQQEVDKLTHERDGLAHKAEGFLVDYEQEKEEKFELRCSLTEVNHQLQQQVEYCTSLGSVCGTLLWRTSQNDECIHNLLSESRVSDFLQLVTSTLHSYLTTYSDSLPDDTSQEYEFVLSLCGTVTNIAASAYGREYLSTCTEGQQLVETMCSLLGTAPVCKECVKIKSINQKGITLLRSQANLLRVLAWLSKEETNSTIVLYCLQLIQSHIYEPLNPALAQQILEALTPDILHKYVSSSNEELKQIACELLMDIQKLQNIY